MAIGCCTTRIGHKSTSQISTSWTMPLSDNKDVLNYIYNLGSSSMKRIMLQRQVIFIKLNNGS